MAAREQPLAHLLARHAVGQRLRPMMRSQCLDDGRGESGEHAGIDQHVGDPHSGVARDERVDPCRNRRRRDACTRDQRRNRKACGAGAGDHDSRRTDIAFVRIARIIRVQPAAAFERSGRPDGRPWRARVEDSPAANRDRR